MPDGPPLADPVERALAAYLDGAADPAARTKRSAVRLAVAQAMRDGVLRDGDLLPPEKRLAEIFGVSVGTVQAALQQLQQRGEIVRRSGYGSRVALGDSFSSAIWHFRIVDRDTGRRLTVEAERIRIDEIAGSAAGNGDEGNGDEGSAAPDDPLAPVWSAFLGPDDSYVRIRRALTMSNGAAVAGRMVLRARTAPRLLEMAPEELHAVNIRSFLQDEFGVATARASTEVRGLCASDTPDPASGNAPAAPVLELRARAVAHDETPVYFQTVRIPSDSCAFAF
ncbi:MAG: GntR family transcriptional regulator [Rhodospirillaceae bacterium]|nr:GntR family transcriptional regulator [Rhodospirillaceae bacterium]MDE0703388.1 GntR family transcriptional regulator [Rhodospirillaceae bacterium]